MMDVDVAGAAMIFTVIFAMSLIVIMLITLNNRDAVIETIQNQAIERGYALHCPSDGKWNWEGDCE